MANYAINGFGRIGRNVLRAMTQKQVQQIRAINDLSIAVKLDLASVRDAERVQRAQKARQVLRGFLTRLSEIESEGSREVVLGIDAPGTAGSPGALIGLWIEAESKLAPMLSGPNFPPAVAEPFTGEAAPLL